MTKLDKKNKWTGSSAVYPSLTTYYPSFLSASSNHNHSWPITLLFGIKKVHSRGSYLQHPIVMLLLSLLLPYSTCWLERFSLMPFNAEMNEAQGGPLKKTIGQCWRGSWILIEQKAQLSLQKLSVQQWTAQPTESALDGGSCRRLSKQMGVKTTNTTLWLGNINTD